MSDNWLKSLLLWDIISHREYNSLISKEKNIFIKIIINVEFAKK